MVPEKFSNAWFHDSILPYSDLFRKCDEVVIQGMADLIFHKISCPEYLTQFLGKTLDRGLIRVDINNSFSYLQNERWHSMPWSFIRAFMIKGECFDLDKIQRAHGLNHLEKHMWVEYSRPDGTAWYEVEERTASSYIKARAYRLSHDLYIPRISRVENVPPSESHRYKEHAFIQIQQQVKHFCPGRWYEIGEVGTWYVAILDPKGRGFIEVPYHQIAKYTERRVSVRPTDEEKVCAIGHQAFRRIEPGMWVRLAPRYVIEGKRDETKKYQGQFYYEEKMDFCGRWHRVNSVNLQTECVYIHPTLKRGGFAFHYHFILEVSRTEPKGQAMPIPLKPSEIAIPFEQIPRMTLEEEIVYLEDAVVRATGIPKEFFRKENTMEETVKELEGIDAENLAKAKAIVDEQLATAQQQKAAKAYTALLNQKDSLEKVLAETQKQLKVVNEGIKKFDDASKNRKELKKKE